MDEQCREALRTLQQECPEVAEWAAKLLAGGYSLSEARTISRALLEMAQGHGIECLRALLIVMRCIAMMYPQLWNYIMSRLSGQASAAGAGGTGAAEGGAATGGAASGGATATDAAAGGAAAGGAAFWAALLFLLFALGFLTWRIYNELYRQLDIGEEGVMPCGGGGGSNAIMGLSPREVLATSMWGRKASLQAAYDEAEADCQRLAGNCTGTCPPGMTCRPVVAVLEVEQWSTFPWFVSYTRLLYTTPCYCV